MEAVFLFQAVDLLACIAWHSAAALLLTPWFMLRCIGSSLSIGKAVRNNTSGSSISSSDGVTPPCTFYEGIVTHIRRAPVENKFKYPLRSAVLSLDNPPAWFSRQAADHMTAEQARRYAGTDGRVLLLTTPSSAGYTQNPISVYYCYDEATAGLSRCIAEVTNTPWNERVTFVFDPKGASVNKSLHVSPFMDMQGTWMLEAPEPGDTLRLVVRVQHPQHGDFFHADLTAVKSQQPSTRSESGGWGMLLRFGFQPHRVAAWIYWQALVLLWKGLPLQGLPSQQVKERAACGASHLRNGVSGTFFSWSPAPRWPWNVQPAASTCQKPQ